MFKKLIICCIVAYFAELCSGGTMTFYHLPSSIEEDPMCSEGLKHQDLTELLSLMLGYSPDKFGATRGFKFSNPFNLPDNIFVLLMSGEIPYNRNRCLHPIYNLPITENLKYDLRDKMAMHAGDDHFVDLNIQGQSNPGLLDLLSKIRHLGSDINFLNGINESNQINKLADSSIIWIDLSGNTLLNQGTLQSLNSPNPVSTTDLDKIVNILTMIFGDNIAVAVVNQKMNVKRVGRSLMQMKDNNTDYNIAPPVSNDFPAVFNIILWISIILGLAVLAVAYGIGNMDPGRDSIIYRMTSQKMKKDA